MQIYGYSIIMRIGHTKLMAKAMFAGYDIEGLVKKANELQAESDRRLELLKEALSILYSMSNARACWPETVEAIEKELGGE